MQKCPYVGNFIKRTNKGVFKGTVMQNEKALINDRLGVSKVL